jgi:hypothetical protein
MIGDCIVSNYIDFLNFVNLLPLLCNLLKKFLLGSEEILNFCLILFSKSEGSQRNEKSSTNDGRDRIVQITQKT